MKAKPLLRRILWFSKQLLVEQVLPSAVSITNRRISQIAKQSSTSLTSSPFLSIHLSNAISSDGALRSGYSSKAWAKYAIPKGLPTEDSKVLAIENDPHFVEDFDGTISEGYGKGTKTLLLSDNVVVKVGGKTSVQRINYHVHDADKAGLHYDLVVTGIKPGVKQWEMNIPRSQFKGRYAIVSTAKGILVTRMKDNGILLPKPDYTLRKEEVLTVVEPSKNSIERKLDGSLANAAIGKEGRVTFRSHRESAGTYYDKLPTLEFINNTSPFLVSKILYPRPDLAGTVFQGELVHPDGAARVSGILNSLAPNARAIQQRRGTIRYIVWDILAYRGRSVSHLPYERRRQLYQEAVQQIRSLNKNWDVIERMSPKETPLAFYNRVTNDPLPYGEGVVIKPLDQSAQKWNKVKLTGFDYFELCDILPGEGKYDGTVGRLVVRNRENGARGEVGSLSVPDEFRDWIWENKDFLIGETVKIRSQAITERGVPRAGVFLGFHDSEVDLLMTAEAAVAGTDRSASEVLYAMKSAAGWRRNGIR